MATEQVDHAPRGPVDRRRPGRQARVWHGAVALVVAVSLVTDLVLIVAGQTNAQPKAVAEAGSMSSKLIDFFSYFTIQSNLLVLVAAVTLALDPDRDGRVWRVLRLSGLLGIVITGLVYDVVLARGAHPQGVGAWTNIGLHYVSPWATLLGWLLFGPRPRITWRVVGWAYAWPVAWIAYTFVHGAFTQWYPYGFVDAHTLGYPVALRNTLGVLVVAGVIAVGLKSLDRLAVVRR